MNRFQQKLRQLELAGRYRALKLPGGIDLTSNDYLGLREHPKLRETAIEALENGIDLGSGGSRLLRGHTKHHAQLEEFAAFYLGYERALFFPCGFIANYAIFTGLADRHDIIIYDSYVHASAKDGIHASNAHKIKVRHNDLNEYEDALKRAKTEKDGGQIWVAVESVYSMDGDLAPLKEIQALAQRYDAMLIVDEAHATGVFGATGRGLAEDLPRHNLITLHTCGKALGVAGGLVCGAPEIIDYMINVARPFIYSTAPMPLQAILVKRAMEICRDEPERREQLFQLRDEANKLLPVPNSPSQIIPIILGETERAMHVADILQKAGFDIRAIRPPTVPEGTSRLRLSLSASLTSENLNSFAGHLIPLLQDKAA